MLHRIAFWTLGMLFCLSANLAWAQAPGEAEARRRVRMTVERNEAIVLFFMHPSVSLKRVDYGEVRRVAGGYSLTCTFHWANVSDEAGYSELAFECTDEGSIDFVRVGESDAFIPPFFASNIVIQLLKDEINKDPTLRENRELARDLESGAKAILEKYLRGESKSLSGAVARLGKGGAAPEPQRRAVDADLLELVLKSESMTDEERKYWQDILPKLNDEQRIKLRDILVNERDQLAAIDRKYAREPAADKAVVAVNNPPVAIATTKSPTPLATEIEPTSFSWWPYLAAGLVVCLIGGIGWWRYSLTRASIASCQE